VEVSPAEPELKISAFFLKLRSKISILQLQRVINEYPDEPLTAIVPGRSMQELWRIVSVLEKAFLAISVVTFVLSLTGMFLVFMTTLNERKREMAILRSVGAGPWFIGSLLFAEVGFLAVTGFALSTVLLHGIFHLTGPWIETKIGLQLALTSFRAIDLRFFFAVIAGALLSGLIPALQVYRTSLNEALLVKL